MTGRRNTFTRIFALYAVIIVLAALVIELYITSTVRGSHIAAREQNLAVQAEIIAEELAYADPVRLDAFCKHLKDMTGARVTVISQHGRVIGDSDRQSSLMDNHADRPEVKDALKNGTGTAIRMSDTLHHDFLYVAKKVALSGNMQGFIRLSVPLKDVDTAVNQLRFKMSLVIVVILAATGLFSFWQIGLLRGLTREVRDFSQALARGEVGKRLFLDAPGEFDEIAESLNAMSGELKKVLANSEEEKHRLNVILRSIPDALLIIDAQGNIQIASAATRKSFGDAPFPGRPLIEVVRNHEFLTLVDSVRHTLAPGTAELFLEYPAERHFVVHVSPLFYERNELSGLVAIFHDITQLKKLEQVRKDFVANISHELKTPITAIQGFAETLLEGALDDREHARKFLEAIRQNSERINTLVDDLMTISKIEMGAITINKAPVFVSEIVDSVMAMLEEHAKGKNLSMTVSIPPALQNIDADKDRLVQILTNLVENAIKFTDKGGITIGMKEERGKRELFVEDTGIGVPEKHLNRLGERFYRVDLARSRKMGGTGLGLAIVKHLVKAHGWDMKIESVPEKGTKVRIIVS
jgi:two-component system, OmpR family, phosphate regulon sensor histidine kinase PhoR